LHNNQLLLYFTILKLKIKSQKTQKKDCLTIFS